MRRRRGHAARRAMLVGLLALGPVAVAPGTADAFDEIVVCNGQADIGKVQAAVDAADSGDLIGLSGTCDFSPAAAHGGTATTIASAAVVVRSGTPVTDLTISASGTADIVGAGDEAAFAILPGNDRVTISGLRFTNVGRAVVAVGTTGTTVDGNRIVGDGSTDSAVLGLGNSNAMTIGHGANGALGPTTVTGASLNDLTVTDNVITYAASGVRTGNRAVAIDVRQDGAGSGGTVDGVEVSGNTVAMFGSDFPSFDQNGIRVEGRRALSTFRVTDVTIADNVLGRLQGVGSPGAGLDPDNAHAAGRVGILVVRASDFDVVGNKVRSRVTTTAATIPGGGIVVSDSSTGSIVSNDSVVVVDPSLPDSRDLGAVAVVEGVPAAVFGDAAVDQATSDVDVAENVVGNVLGNNSDGVGARRGIVASGADLATVWNNEVRSGSAALHIGATVQGPTGSLPRTVTRSVFCDNVLNGSTDQASQVSFNSNPASPSTGNAFPGGASAGNNLACTPTVTASPAPPSTVGAGGSLTVAGKAWAARPTQVKVTDENGTTLTRSGSATAAGTYSEVFSDVPSELGSLVDGRLVIETTTSDPTGPAGTAADRPGSRSVQTTAILNRVFDPPAPGAVEIHDGDGFTNGSEGVPPGVRVTWTAAGGPVENAIIWVSDHSGTTPAPCGPWVVPPTGDGSIPLECFLAIPERTSDNHEGTPYSLNGKWRKSDTSESSVVSDTSLKDTHAVTPVIVSPAENEVVTVAPTTFSGTTEKNAVVTLRAEPTKAFVASTTANSSGNWSVSAALEERTHRVSAFVTDPAGNRSASSPIRTFRVASPQGGDVTPPDAPVITSPATNSLQPASFQIRGTAEPLSLVKVFANGFDASQTGTNAEGSWVTTLSLPEGTWNLTARAIDAAGNVGALSSPAVVVDVDASIPAITITNPRNRDIVIGAVNVSGSAGDNRGVCKIVVEYWRSNVTQGSGAPSHVTNETVTGCPLVYGWSSSAPSTLPAGVYAVVAKAFDAAGNAKSDEIAIVKAP